jgi:hypothetical protein
MKSILFALASSALTFPAFGQERPVLNLVGIDPLIGTWKFNYEKSTQIGGGPKLKSGTQTWTGDWQTFTNTAEGVNDQGQAIKTTFQHIYDGMPHSTPTTINNPDYDASAYTRVGNTINAVRFKQGKTVEVGQIAITPGKSYTVTAEGVTASGLPYHYVLVFEMQ